MDTGDGKGAWEIADRTRQCNASTLSIYRLCGVDYACTTSMRIRRANVQRRVGSITKQHMKTYRFQGGGVPHKFSLYIGGAGHPVPPFQTGALSLDVTYTC